MTQEHQIRKNIAELLEIAKKVRLQGDSGIRMLPIKTTASRWQHGDKHHNSSVD